MQDKYKVRAFYGSKIALEGFDDTEKVGMIKLIEENEGFCVGAADPTVTHIVSLIIFFKICSDNCSCRKLFGCYFVLSRQDIKLFLLSILYCLCLSFLTVLL